jgi:hypothetical protein
MGLGARRILALGPAQFDIQILFVERCRDQAMIIRCVPRRVLALSRPNGI